VEAGIPAEPVNTRANTLAISEGEGVLGREATWDDYPNGRWGDARSPAYGQIDGYGVSLHVSVSQAIRLWGTPTKPDDVSGLFIRHLSGELSAIPWSEEGFNAETGTIRERLIALNSRGWWTLASQPAVNGLRSTDPTFGWGPANGFIFQKAFVEFFLPAADWEVLRGKIVRPEMRDAICFYATNAAGDFLSSDMTAGTPLDGAVPAGRHQPSTNAVTWGVFPGKEIVTPTIIEEVSFRAWGEEAFSIWAEWAKVYGKGSEAGDFLQGVREGSWLVNIIHHDFIEKDALWDLLLK
jgi:methylenetetrahydrofolate reductase (NADPH)